METRGPKEICYDEQINPLMAQIIALCKEHKINTFATFVLDLDENEVPIFCTTSLPVDRTDDVGFTKVNECARIVYAPRPTAGFKITTEHADGSKTVEHVVVAQ